MKARIYLILLSLMLTYSLCGCQHATAKTEGQPVVAEASSKSTPCQPKTQKFMPPQNEYSVRWQEQCSVEQASSASAIVLGELGFGQDFLSQTRTVQTRDPKTGKMVTKRVPVNNRPVNNRNVRSDGLSAGLEVNSTAGIKFQISILLMPPESSAITITATSPVQPKTILEQQSHYLMQKISETIQQEPVQSEPVPYPETMIINRPADEIYQVIYRFANDMGFERDSCGRDHFFQCLRCRTASNINMNFITHLIDANKTKLEINVQNYEDKEEFPMILKNIEDVLKELQQGQPAAGKAEETENVSKETVQKSCQDK